MFADVALTLPNTEVQAFRFLQQHGIIASRKKCKCGREMHLRTYEGKPPGWRKRSHHHCTVKSCSVRAGSWLCDMRSSLLAIVKFLNAWCQELTSVEWCRKELRMKERLAVKLEDSLREVCAHSISSKSVTKIGGPGKIVEVDESLYIRRKDNSEKLNPVQWVIGGVCKETKECFIVEVAHRSGPALLNSIRNHIAEGSIIYSECWRRYNVEELKGAFADLKMSHKFDFVGPESADQNQFVDRIWGSVNWRSKKRFGVERETFYSYFIEFIWRHGNHKNDILREILDAIREFWPPEEQLS